MLGAYFVEAHSQTAALPQAKASDQIFIIPGGRKNQAISLISLALPAFGPMVSIKATTPALPAPCKILPGFQRWINYFGPKLDYLNHWTPWL
jgi:hypothetical protein